MSDPTSPVSPAAVSLTLDEAYALAVRHHDAGRLSEARELFQVLLEARPGHPEIHFRLGQIALALGYSESAAEHLAAAEAQVTEVAEIPYYRGLAFKRLGQWDSAVGCYERALALRPVYEDAKAALVLAHQTLGERAVNAGRLEDAAAHFEAMIRLDAGNGVGYLGLSAALHRLGRDDDAAPLRREGTRLCLGYPEPYGRGEKRLFEPLPDDWQPPANPAGSPVATVIIPTFNHTETLWRSLASVQAQAVQDLEIFVIGDGAPARTGEILAKLQETDPRIRYFDHPKKGPRHGEIYRNAILPLAKGRIVCYLGDDDLWLPQHVATLAGMLQDGSFAHTAYVTARTDGTLAFAQEDEDSPAGRDPLLRFRRISPTCAGHTRSAYAALPHGWRTTPPGIPTDAYMWLQFHDQPDWHGVSLMRQTMVHFPSGERRGWTIAERCAELDRWIALLNDAGANIRVQTG